MTNIDDSIKQALEQEDQEWFDSLAEPSPLGQVIDSFRTRNRFLIAFSIIITVALMGVFIWCAIEMFNAPETREQILWAMGVFFTIQGITAIKLWYFMELNKNSTIREIKRVELQVARMMARQSDAENTNAV
ncbi:MAG: hypothetical protein ACI89L_001557 [Phycisphaerales bacterium]|jgi:hypothetical protein